MNMNIKGKRNKLVTLAAMMCLICLLLLTLASCDEVENIPIDIELADLAEYIGSKTNLDDFIDIPSSKKQNDYNISEENTVQAIVMVSLNINSSEEIILIEAVDEDSAKEITDVLKERQVLTLRGLENYDANPENETQYHIVESSKMITKGNYIFWAIHSENSEINNMIDEFIKENNQTTTVE